MRKAAFGAMALAVASFVLAVGYIFQLRFDSGDIYPPYSSLRADPMGVRVLHDSLSRMPGIAVARNMENREALNGYTGTVFLLGIYPVGFSHWASKALDDLEKIAAGGGRLIVGLRGDVKVFDNDSLKAVEVRRWNVRFVYDEGYLIFEDLADKGRRTMEIERPVGKGSIVLLANAFALSNEGMIGEREPEQVARLVGLNSKVMFEESHFGIQESGGVAKLARKYGLTGFAAACVVLAMLFLWKSSMSLVPPLADPGDGGSAIEGKDSASGFVNLLRRSVGERELLATCVEHWRKTAHLGRGLSAARQERVEMVARSGEKDPVAGWRRIRQILEERITG